ncbi:MAG TPA: hypothetical protein PK711_10280 [Bacteroidales bacterium]|nr:hypothetical protein [Bacteroidales bacterium]HRZ22199.1 hypothetical protein [Bacteroidales bacterium]
MALYNKKGMLFIPTPERTKAFSKVSSLLVISQCYCPEGHNLVSSRAIFDGYEGILLKVRKGDQTGLVALSPVYGVKSRISYDIDLKKGDILQILCPVCEKPFPLYHPCSCGGHLVTIFMDEKINYSNCILICNRVDCFNAELRFHDELVHYDSTDQIMFG